MLDRAHADKIAVWFALLAAVVAATLVVRNGPDLDPPTKTVSVLKVGTPAEGSAQPRRSTTKTVEVGAPTFAERVLGRGGIVLLEVGLVLLIGFLCGAFAQRLLVGDFAMKLGPLQLDAVQARAEETFVDLTAKLATLTEAQARQAKDLEAVADRMSDASVRLVSVGTAISALNDRLVRLENDDGGRDGG